MAANNSNPAFLVAPTLSELYPWRVIAAKTRKSIRRFKDLAAALAKAEALNSHVQKEETNVVQASS